MHNIHVTPKLVIEVITTTESSKASGFDCFPVVILKNWEPELSSILGKLFNTCLRGSYFPSCWRTSFLVSVFNNIWEKFTAKNYWLVSLSSVIIKMFEKLENYRLDDHLEKLWPLSWFSLWFQFFLIYCRSSDSCIW